MRDRERQTRSLLFVFGRVVLDHRDVPRLLRFPVARRPRRRYVVDFLWMLHEPVHQGINVRGTCRKALSFNDSTEQRTMFSRMIVGS